jgi:hypothetical protein
MRRGPKKLARARGMEFFLYEFEMECGCSLRVMAMNQKQGEEIAREVLSKTGIYEGPLALISTISFPDFASQR